MYGFIENIQILLSTFAFLPLQYVVLAQESEENPALQRYIVRKN
jgi:hypothetical protein